MQSTHVGVDPTAGRFADVSVIECLRCGRSWLKYAYEHEPTPHSGRWYAGLVPPDQVEGLAPIDAPALLEGLPWHLVGGSYFGGRVFRSSGQLVDL